MNIWSRYKEKINKNCSDTNEQVNGLHYWQNKLFATILIYLLPLSILAIVPGIYMSIISSLYLLAAIDFFALAFIFTIAFLPYMSIAVRKALLIFIIYLVAVVLLYNLGSFGPGLLYLNAVTIFVLLIFSKKAAQWSVAVNLLICIAFGMALHYGWLPISLVPKHDLGAWIAVCVNLIILCTVTVILLPMLFNGLQDIITQLKLQEEKTIAVNRLYQFISQVSQTIVHATDEKVLYQKICDIALHYGHYDMAWIAKYDDSDNSIYLVAECGSVESDQPYLVRSQVVEGAANYRIKKNGGYEVLHDIGNAPISEKWKNHLLQRGFHSTCILSFQMFGNVVAALYLFSHQEGVFNQQEVRLLQELAGDVSFALEGFEKERQRKEIDDRLNKSEALMKSAQQIAHLGSWEIDMTTFEIIWSDEMFRIFGEEIGAVVPSIENFFSFIHPEDLEWMKDEFGQLQNQLGDVANYYRILRRDGTVRHVYSEAKFQFNANGSATRLYGTIYDVTEELLAQEKIKASEIAIRILNGELEERVLKRTADLLDANYELEAFSFTVSHDLRTPIRAVQIFADLLKKKHGENGDETTNTYLDNIMTCTYEMNALINDLLSFSKLGRLALKNTNVDIHDMVKGVTASIVSVEEGKQIDIEVGELLPVEADATLIRSVWLNLISNAVKYSKRDGPCQIQISSEMSDGSVIYKVQDNGVGFNMKYYDKLFKPFSRLHSSSEYKGTGAGLAICERIIKKHKGQLWAESVLGAGSTFYFSLPVNVSVELTDVQS